MRTLLSRDVSAASVTLIGHGSLNGQRFLGGETATTLPKQQPTREHPAADEDEPDKAARIRAAAGPRSCRWGGVGHRCALRGGRLHQHHRGRHRDGAQNKNMTARSLGDRSPPTSARPATYDSV